MKPTDDLRSWAAAYREAGQAPQVLRERILAAVHDAEIEVRVEPKSWRAWGVGLGVGGLLGVAALLLLSWAVRWMRPELEPSPVPSVAPYERVEREDAASQAEPKATSRPRARTVVEAPPVTTLAPVPASDAPRAPARKAVAPEPATSEPAMSEPAMPEPATSSADLESLRRLRAAKEILPVDPAKARALIEAHARDYPRSPAALEREALWIRAACRSGGASGLDRRRAAFAKRPGVAAYLAAIAQDCDR